MDDVQRLGHSIMAQGYRPVDLTVLSPDGLLNISGSTQSDLDQAMDGVQTASNWVEVGRQLALFTERSERHAVYLRGDPSVLKMAVVVVVPGAPATESAYQEPFEHC